MSYRFVSFLTALSAVVFLSGCNDLFKKVSGVYPGVASIETSGTTTSQKVIASVSRTSKEITISVASESDTPLFRFSLRRKGDELYISSSDWISSENVSLKIRGQCANSETKSKIELNACLSETSLSLSLSNPSEKKSLALYVSKIPQPLQNQRGLETGTLDELIDRVKNFTFDTEVKAEQLLQARQHIRMARAALRPRLSIEPVLKIVEMDFNLSDVLEYVVPFILPGRWFELDRQKLLYEAERLSDATVLADQILLAEELYFNIVRDQFYEEELKKSLDELEPLYEKTKHQAKLGFIDLSIELDLRGKVSAFKQDLVEIKTSLRQQYITLYYFLGLPSNGESVKLKAPTDLDLPMQNYVEGDYKAKVLAASLELQQYPHLERAAEKSSSAINARFWDPSIDPKQALTFGASAPFKIEKSSLNILILKQRQTELRLMADLSGVIIKLASVKSKSTFAEEELLAAEELLQRELLNVKLGKEKNIFPLSMRFDQVLSKKLSVLNVKVAHLFAKERLNRLTLEGRFENILESIPN